MARSQTTFSKREREKKKARKRIEKIEKKEERRANSDGGDFDSMLAYVDEFGNILDTPPDPLKKKKMVKAEDIVIGVPKMEHEEVDPVHQGRVAFFNDSKGYGFINETGTQERYFVHVNGLMEEIQENDKVSFELERGPKGMNAIKVKRVV